MKTMWKAMFNELHPFEVVKETDKQVVFINSNGKECREAKLSDYHSWHNTKGEAKVYLIERENKKIESLKRQIDTCKSKIKNIEQL